MHMETSAPPIASGISGVHQVYRAQIASLEAELARLRGQREWRPIESAPKNGEHIWAAQAGTIESGEIYYDEDYKRWASLADECYEPNWLPTHWMPLPAVPTSQSGGSQE